MAHGARGASTAAFPVYTAAERRADAGVHAAGVAAGTAAVVVLATMVMPGLAPVPAASVAVYAASLLAVFVASAAYNLAGHEHWKEILRRFDHAAIYVLIAGTYTPFGAFALSRDGDSFVLLAAVWAIALTGVALKLALPRRLERMALALYLLQGWAVLAAPRAMLAGLSGPALVLLGIGGALYTSGVAFHLWRRLPYHNAIWHLFVLAAAACHFAAVLLTFAPA